ncbi:Cytochrome P450 76A2 [Vitis vinifera]|uniref:Cytochrome P450 76A2 n=1 Tax=Vitis vinifera TaxID=29760 RepID=A0A438EKF1_VITVI|nr:Cytochrome P450 76A2 [Vitis vinifera]
MSNLTEWSGHPNLADFFQWLGWLDLQGPRKNMERDLGKAMEMASGFVNERMKKQRTEGTKRKDFLDVLLEFEGNETSSSIVEWVMTELLRNPKSMSEVEDELARAVVKETLRLHPPIPFLIPRSAIQDTSFMGYHIPKDTQVLVNAWAIGRDPGRRICAGIPLAHRVLHLVLGTLLHQFDWQLEGNVTPETMDMKEKRGLVMRESQPLKAVPKKLT